MQVKVNDKITQRREAYEEAMALLDTSDKENRSLTDSERETYDALKAKIVKLRAEIEGVAAESEEDKERRAFLEDEGAALAQSRGRKTITQTGGDGTAEPSDEERDMAFRAWMMGKQAPEHFIEAAQRCKIDHTKTYIDMAMRERRGPDGTVVRKFLPVITNRGLDIIGVKSGTETRALSVGTTTAGGNAVSNEMIRAYYEVQKWFARFPEECLQVNTETGATLPWPTVTDTGNTGRILAEATTATTTTDPTFAVVNLGAFKVSSDAVLVSWELAQDIWFDISTYLGMALGRRIARLKNTKSTVGAGTTEPKGVITAATVGVTAAVSTAFTFDEVIALLHTLDPAYRSIPGTSFMMHDTIAKTIRTFKDGQGRYLWEMSTQAGCPDRLLGFPVLINNDMDSALTTGKKLIAFGNWTPQLGSYIVRTAGAVRFVRADELKVLEHQIVFEASQRYDSNLVDTTACKVLALA